MSSVGSPSPGDVVDGAVWDEAIEGWVLRRTSEWIVSVSVAYLFNDRLILTRVEQYPRLYAAGWCYPKGGAAFAAGAVFDPERDWEPVGFLRVAVDDRGPRPADA